MKIRILSLVIFLAAVIAYMTLALPQPNFSEAQAVDTDQNATPSATLTPPVYNASEGVTVACNSENFVYVDMTVANHEDFPIKATAENKLFTTIVDFGTITPGNSILARYGLQLHSVTNADDIHFTFTKTDGSNPSSVDLGVPDISCDGTTPTTSVTPTDSPTATPTTSVTPTVTPTESPADCTQDCNNQEQQQDQSQDQTINITYNQEVLGATVAPATNTTQLPSTGAGTDILLGLISLIPAGLKLRKWL